MSDLKILPAGDLTEIGQKGINLSGGQKARVSLARAVYSDRDIFLMDDPISALDANVRQKIISNVILGHLRGKTRILVTHAIDFIHLADRIIIMDKGCIAEEGSFDELIQKDSKILKNLLEVNHINRNNMTQESPVRRSEIRKDVRLNASVKTASTVDEVNREFELLGSVSKDNDGKIIKNENEEVIRVKLSTYADLIRLCGGWPQLLAVNVVLAGFVYFKIMTDYTCGQWASDQTVQKEKYKMFTILVFTYASSASLMMLLRCFLLFMMTLRGSRNLHNQMVAKVLRAPVNLFFDVTPTGNIMNRFSKDLQVIDNNLSFSIGNALVQVYQLISVLIVISVTNWYIALGMPLVFVCMVCLFRYALPGYKECTRVESVSKSPVLNLISETTAGGPTIKAFETAEVFTAQFGRLLNHNILAWQFYVGVWNWFSLRVNLISVLLMASSTLVCIQFRFEEDPVMIGMTLSYILQLQDFMVFLLWSLGDLEKSLVSVQRCCELQKVPQERQEGSMKLLIPDSHMFFEKQWPAEGRVSFNDVQLRYRPNTELVLQGLTFNIEAGQKVGVVGRTGAGKSTLSLALTRIVEIESGEILIDGFNIS